MNDDDEVSKFAADLYSWLKVERHRRCISGASSAYAQGWYDALTLVLREVDARVGE